MARPDDIVGYAYCADLYCPSCITQVLPTGEGGKFDGWALAKGAAPMSAEENLNEIAFAFGIDRQAEETFDSGDFPKVCLRDQVRGEGDYSEGDEPSDETADRCGKCGALLDD